MSPSSAAETEPGPRRRSSVSRGHRGHACTTSLSSSAGWLPIAASGRIAAEGVFAGTAPVRVEADLGTAIAEADVIFIVVPTMHQLTYAELLAPLLRDGMNVVLMPGSLGSLGVRRGASASAAATADITVSEIAALPYATRIVGPGLGPHLRSASDRVDRCVPSALRADRVMPVMRDLYPGHRSDGRMCLRRG
ncbi:MAG: hypothetical protein V9E98_11005 [Candidatus Nanopelagicales bacterium]